MYVTLPSHANRQEFSNNQANWFKIRLPHPLRLTGESWQVGLSSISMPDTGVNLGHLVPAGEAVFDTSYVRYNQDRTRTYKFYKMTMEDLKDDDSIVDGVSFMKAYLRWIDQQVVNDFKHHYESTDKYGTKTLVCCLNGTKMIYCWIIPMYYDIEFVVWVLVISCLILRLISS